MGMGTDKIQRLFCIVFQYPKIINSSLGDTGCQRNTVKFAVFPYGTPHYVIGMTMIGIFKHHYFITLRNSPHQFQGSHDRFRAGIGEGDPLHAGKLLDQLSRLSGFGRTRAKKPVRSGTLQGIPDKIRIMTKQCDSLTHCNIHVLVAVDIPEVGTFTVFACDRIEHLLCCESKADCSTAVSKCRAIAGSQSLGLAGTLCVTTDQCLKMFSLSFIQPACPNFQWGKHTVHYCGRGGFP